MKTKTAWLMALSCALPFAHAGACAATPDTVKFASADGATGLTGYLYRPSGAGPHPAIVMLHGRGGPYSSLKRGTYSFYCPVGGHEDAGMKGRLIVS